MTMFRAALLGSVLSIAIIAPQIAKADDINRLSIGIGEFNTFESKDEAADFRIEYRPGTSIVWELRPWLGAEVTSDGGVWGGGGFLYDFHLAENWYLTPSLGAGLFTHGSGKDLGNAIEFRSQVELGYQFENQSRVSVGINNMSNAGIDNKNPGEQTVELYYHLPMSWVKGNNNGY